MRRIYLDWNATAPLLGEVADAVAGALTSTYGNASSVHREGQAARSVVERARRAVARSVNAPAQGVVLTGGATESNNQVLRHHVRSAGDVHIVHSAVEHPSVLEVARDIGREGRAVSEIPVDAMGRIDVEAAEELAGEATLLSVMLANNETGNVHPVRQLADLARANDVLLHVDATQAYGRIAVDFAALGADYMTLSFHKAGGPKGIGAIVAREGSKVEALLAGGHQERGRRPGTENVPAAAGLEALARAVTANVDEWTGRMETLRKEFIESIDVAEPALRGDPVARLPNTVNVAFEGVDGEDLLLALDLAGVAASSGSACTAGSLEPSHVILSMGFDEPDARRSVRFSFGPSTTVDELKRAADIINETVERLRAIPGRVTSGASGTSGTPHVDLTE